MRFDRRSMPESLFASFGRFRRSHEFWLLIVILVLCASQNSWLRRNLPNEAKSDSGIDRLSKRIFGCVFGRYVSCQTALAHHQHAMAMIENLRDFVRDHQHCDALAGQPLDDLVDS